MQREVEIVTVRILEILKKQPALQIPQITRIYKTRYAGVCSSAIGKIVHTLQESGALKSIPISPSNRVYWVTSEVFDRVLGIVSEQPRQLGQIIEIYRKQWGQIPEFESFHRLLILLSEAGILELNKSVWSCTSCQKEECA